MVNRLKLNEKTVREAENLGRDYQIFDTDVRGFSVTIYPSGNRAFTLDYRIAGRQRRIAELARAGLTPDWMPGVVPRCVPLEIKNNQHGERATTIVVGTERVKTRGKWRTVEVLACPVTWRPHQEQIASARRGYEDWWQALDWVRDGLLSGRMLREVEVKGTMPKVQPWSLIASAKDAHEVDEPLWPFTASPV